jgi:anti-sigma regulatory factor (Ser/Thr protein kinase)
MNGVTAVRVFPGSAEQAREVRRWLRSLAPCGEGPNEASHAAELAATELFANAIGHTRSGGPGGTVTVAVTEDGHIHVHDLGTGPGAPCPSLDPAPPGKNREDGRGLLVVAALCDDLTATPVAKCPIVAPGAVGGCCVTCRPGSWLPRRVPACAS